MLLYTFFFNALMNFWNKNPQVNSVLVKAFVNLSSSFQIFVTTAPFGDVPERKHQLIIRIIEVLESSDITPLPTLGFK